MEEEEGSFDRELFSQRTGRDEMNERRVEHQTRAKTLAGIFLGHLL